MRNVLLGVLVCLALAAGCKKTAAPGILIYARGADSKKLDPADITDGESVKVCTNLFETLVTFGPASTGVVPCLATEWTVSVDGRTWTFTLREGVTFHDGTKLDAEAVVFNFQRLLDEENPFRFGGAFSYAENYAMVVSVKSDGPNTVVFHLSEPSAVFLVNLAMFPASIQSPGAIRKHGEDYFKNPVGTGPFRFVLWESNVKIVLEAYDGYWGKKARVKRVIFKPVPENSARRIQLERGEITMMDGINFSDVKGLKANTDLTVDVQPGMNFGYLAMNTTKPPFDKPAVRRAVAHAVDKAKIMQLAFHGFGKTGPNPMPPAVFGYNTKLEDRAYDPALAKRMLEKAGVKEGLSVTLFAMPNPRPYMPQPRKVAQVIKENLKAVGIEAEIVSPEWQLYLEQVMNAKHDLCLLGWSTDNGDPDNFLWQLFDSQNAKIGSAMNVSFYRNPAADDLFRKAKKTIDKDARRALYEKAQELLFEDAPVVPLAYFHQVVAYRKHLAGYRLHPIGLVRLWEASVGNR